MNTINESFQPDATDDKIIRYLKENGNASPKMIGDSIGSTRQFVTTRLRLLQAAGWVQKEGHGIYSLVTDPRE